MSIKYEWKFDVDTSTFILSIPNLAYIKNRIFSKEFLLEFLEGKNEYFDTKFENYVFKVENVLGCKSKKLRNLSVIYPSLLSFTLIVKAKKYQRFTSE